MPFIVGFNVRPTPQARQQAEADDVEIRLHSIIYKVIEEMEEAMKGMLDPEFEEKIIGEAVIRETFKVSKVGTIGGFMVTVVRLPVTLKSVSSVTASLSMMANSQA